MEIHGTAATSTKPASSAHRKGQIGRMPRGRIDTADGAGRIKANAERRREQTDAHRQDDDHRVMHFMDAELACDRKQKRAEQDDRRDAFEHAAEDHESRNRHRHKSSRAARQPRHVRREIA